MLKPARDLFTALGLGLAVAILGVAPLAQAASGADWTATDPKYAAMVMDASNGEVLYEKNADAQRYPASITKIMTLYMAFDALSSGKLKLDDRVPISRHAASMAPSKLGVPAGGSVSVDEAMRSIAVISANDMAVALAEKIGGSEAKFTALMTLRAQALGMNNTRYVNANGLPDPRQVSSAHDIAILSRAVMRDFPQYYGYFSLKSFTYNGRTVINHNHLLDKMAGVDGLKTGFINASGFNLSASAVRDNHRLIAVVLGGNTAGGRDAQVKSLLETGFALLHRRDLGEKVTISQNDFEPSANGSAPERTAGETVNGKIDLSDAELASLRAADAAPPKAAPVQTARADVPAQPTARLIRVRAEIGGRHGRKSEGEWRVQVGAYDRKAGAQAQLSAIEHRYADAFEGATGHVTEAGHGKYNARFVGFSMASARDACRTLKAHHQDCVALPPES